MKKTTATIAALCVAFTASASADNAKSAQKADASKSSDVAPKSSDKPAKWPEYRGKAFKVSYPAGWKAQPLEAKTAKDSDAATFTSPDGTMQFYIFSPQWSGTAPGIALDAAKETETARNTDRGMSSGVKGTFTWHTITAKDKSYTRTYQSFLAEGEPIHWVIGMKYANEATLAKYRADYARFKGSLEQYAD
jgi:hypothetical protein